MLLLSKGTRSLEQHDEAGKHEHIETKATTGIVITQVTRDTVATKPGITVSRKHWDPGTGGIVYQNARILGFLVTGTPPHFLRATRAAAETGARVPRAGNPLDPRPPSATEGAGFWFLLFLWLRVAGLRGLVERSRDQRRKHAQAAPSNPLAPRLLDARRLWSRGGPYRVTGTWLPWKGI